MKKSVKQNLLPLEIERKFLNPAAKLPFGCKPEHVFKAMHEFIEFLSFVNAQLITKKLPRLEEMLMPANFSSTVGEFMSANIPKYCSTIAKNNFHNGHPDLVPKGKFKGDSIQYCQEGLEIKASRYLRGWQGHNPEDIWLMVFVFDSNRPVDKAKGVSEKPFRFIKVLAAELTKKDWLFAGRSETSRRTITASVTPAGYQKMAANWIYQAPPVDGSDED